MGDKAVYAKTVVVSVVIAILVFSAMVYVSPDSTPFSPNNYGWNGIRDFYTYFHVHSVDGAPALASSASSAHAALLEVDPAYPFAAAEVSAISSFVAKGGTLVVAAVPGSNEANQLLSSLNVGVRILNVSVGVRVENVSVGDPLFYRDTLYNPIALTGPALGYSGLPGEQFVKGVKGITMFDPAGLNVTSTAVIVLAYSGLQSLYVYPLGYTPTTSSSATRKLVGEEGPFPLVAAQKIGSGWVVVTGDPLLFTNSEWSVGQNKAFLEDLFSNSTVYIDAAHWPVNTNAVVRSKLSALRSTLSTPPANYLATAAFAGLSIVFTTPWERRRTPTPGAATRRYTSPVTRDRSA